MDLEVPSCTYFTNLFWHEMLYVSDSSSVHHQEFIHCTVSNIIGHTAFEQDHALISQIYSGMKLYMFRTVPLSIIRNLFTVQSAIL